MTPSDLRDINDRNLLELFKTALLAVDTPDHDPNQLENEILRRMAPEPPKRTYSEAGDEFS